LEQGGVGLLCVRPEAAFGVLRLLGALLVRVLGRFLPDATGWPAYVCSRAGVRLLLPRVRTALRLLPTTRDNARAQKHRKIRSSERGAALVLALLHLNCSLLRATTREMAQLMAHEEGVFTEKFCTFTRQSRSRSPELRILDLVPGFELFGG
jgi:hypothetical protein